MLNYLYPYPENSQLVLYVRRCVRALGKSELGKDTTTVNSTIDQSMVNSTAITTSVNKVPEELTNLFKRIKEDIFDGVGLMFLYLITLEKKKLITVRGGVVQFYGRPPGAKRQL